MKKKRILIAESIRSSIDVGNTLFSRGGVGVFFAASCEDLLQHHRENRADLIIADLDQPSMGGAALCSVIRGDPSLRDVSIIMACDGTESAIDECKRATVNAVLTKPLDAAELFSTVSRLLMVHQRLAVRTPLRLTVEGKDAKNAFIGISRDISVSGMLLESVRALKKGERVECSFTLNSRVVSVTGLVSRTHKTQRGAVQYGIRFLNLDAKTFVLIEHFIKSAGAKSAAE
jgi:CheY-like chemotaxis protein